jgi:serine/threonine-protein kinase RIO1
MTYWRHRDLSYYNIILFQQNINNFEKYIDLLEAAKAENPDLVRLYLKGLDIEIVKKIVDFYESTR